MKRAWTAQPDQQKQPKRMEREGIIGPGLSLELNPGVRSPCDRPVGHDAADREHFVEQSQRKHYVAPASEGGTFPYSPRSSEHPSYELSFINCTGTPYVSSSGSHSGQAARAQCTGPRGRFSDEDQSTAARTPSESVSGPITLAAARTQSERPSAVSTATASDRSRTGY
jgi:hypothetical protein